MFLILVSAISALSALQTTSQLPLVENTTCTLPKDVRKIFEKFFKKHHFPTHWDCGLENLAIGEFDRAENATTSYPLSEAAKKYFTLTSKGINVKNALRRIPKLFLDDKYATNLDYQDEDSTKP
ncbi:hypothetical protein DICVIV_00029 [Dictyocaulus viviparus]|uniref:Uncharacterized protein n=1 Tax=Dictyocaulus viviparus TaxID=29172 RepID=A0A0D8YG07_DICVI|nr:hypothetical protein DICVIV_00029 [Dictyocaulus viviparus]